MGSGAMVYIDGGRCKQVSRKNPLTFPGLRIVLHEIPRQGLNFSSDQVVEGLFRGGSPTHPIGYWKIIELVRIEVAQLIEPALRALRTSEN